MRDYNVNCSSIPSTYRVRWGTRGAGILASGGMIHCFRRWGFERVFERPPRCVVAGARFNSTTAASSSINVRRVRPLDSGEQTNAIRLASSAPMHVLPKFGGSACAPGPCRRCESWRFHPEAGRGSLPSSPISQPSAAPVRLGGSSLPIFGS